MFSDSMLLCCDIFYFSNVIMGFEWLAVSIFDTAEPLFFTVVHKNGIIRGG